MGGRRRRPACPYCGNPADEIVYGLLAGPPEPGYVMGGCVVRPGRDPEFCCTRCDAEWRFTDDGVLVIVNPGVNSRGDEPEGSLLDSDLEATSAAHREELQQLDSGSQEGTYEYFARLGAEYGLTPEQSQMLRMYL